MLRDSHQLLLPRRSSRVGIALAIRRCRSASSGSQTGYRVDRSVFHRIALGVDWVVEADFVVADLEEATGNDLEHRRVERRNSDLAGRPTLVSGKLAYCYNLFGAQRFKVYGNAALPAGEHQVRAEFNYDGGGLGRAARSRCSSMVLPSALVASTRHNQ